MTGPDDSAADVRLWMAYAEQDLAAAQRMLADGAFAPRQAAYFGQQAAEKAVKAVLVAAGVEVPRTHDLTRLVGLAPLGAAVAATGADLEALSDMATGARYPDDWTPVDDALAAQIVRDASELVGSARIDVARLAGPA